MTKQPKHRRTLTAAERDLIAMVFEVAAETFKRYAGVAPAHSIGADHMRQSDEIEALAAILAGADSIVLEMTKP